MNVARRIQIGAVLALALGTVAAATAGTVASMVGVGLPQGLGSMFASAGDILGWLRVVIVGLLAFGVFSARE